MKYLIATCWLALLPNGAFAETGALAGNAAFSGALDAASYDLTTKNLEKLKGFSDSSFDAGAMKSGMRLSGGSQLRGPQGQPPPVRYVPPARVRRFALGGALSGAIIGGLTLGPLGAIAGALVGFAAGTYAGHRIIEPTVGVVAGAVAGGMLGGPPGVVIGGILGGLAGLALSFLL